MFQLKYSKRYQNQIYTKYEITFPEEDYYVAEGNLFCVADGVTRDLIGGEIKPYPKTKEEAEYIAEHYPNPSGAFEASKIIANQFVKYVRDENPNQEVIKNAIRKANEVVWTINENRKIDYVGEDLYCCEAVGGVITDEYLYAFGIGDCYIKVFDENQDELFSTENDHLCMEKFEEEYLKKGKYDWFDPRSRLLIRGALRNNYLVTYQGEHVGYGALTGEQRAMDFVKIAKVPLKKAKYIVAYSDGCMPYFENKEEVKKTLENPDRIKENGSERTLIVYERGAGI